MVECGKLEKDLTSKNLQSRAIFPPATTENSLPIELNVGLRLGPTRVTQPASNNNKCYE